MIKKQLLIKTMLQETMMTIMRRKEKYLVVQQGIKRHLEEMISLLGIDGKLMKQCIAV